MHLLEYGFTKNDAAPAPATMIKIIQKMVSGSLYQ
jgi:hypothetical protein